MLNCYYGYYYGYILEIQHALTPVYSIPHHIDWS